MDVTKHPIRNEFMWYGHRLYQDGGCALFRETDFPNNITVTTTPYEFYDEMDFRDEKKMIVIQLG